MKYLCDIATFVMKKFLCLMLLLAGLSAGAQEMNSLQFRARVVSPELSQDAVTFRNLASFVQLLFK